MITSALTETLLRESRPQLSLLEPEGAFPNRSRRSWSPGKRSGSRRLEWQRAAHVARQVINPTYRSEYLDRVVEGMAKDSGRITEFVRPTDSAEVRNEPPKLDAKDIKEYEESADSFLVEAAELAGPSSGPSGGMRRWRGRRSRRANRGNMTGPSTWRGASRTPRPAPRRSCSSPSRSAATTSPISPLAPIRRRPRPWHASSRTGLRGVLTGFLVDSLISTGRFDDARACLVLYPTESERFVAHGGHRRGRGPPRVGRRSRGAGSPTKPRRSTRSALYRRVNTGVLAAISNERQNQYSSREAPGPAGR